MAASSNSISSKEPLDQQIPQQRSSSKSTLQGHSIKTPNTESSTDWVRIAKTVASVAAIIIGIALIVTGVSSFFGVVVLLGGSGYLFKNYIYPEIEKSNAEMSQKIEKRTSEMVRLIGKQLDDGEGTISPPAKDGSVKLFYRKGDTIEVTKHSTNREALIKLGKQTKTDEQNQEKLDPEQMLAPYLENNNSIPLKLWADINVKPRDDRLFQAFVSGKVDVREGSHSLSVQEVTKLQQHARSRINPSQKPDIFPANKEVKTEVPQPRLSISVEMQPRSPKTEPSDQT